MEKRARPWSAKRKKRDRDSSKISNQKKKVKKRRDLLARKENT